MSHCRICDCFNLYYFVCHRKLSTAIITRGTLRKGSFLVGGHAWAKVRGLFDHNSQPIEAATPGVPVEILGWREVPLAGDQILEVKSEKKAHSVMHFRQQAAKQAKAEHDLDAIKKKQQEHLAVYNERRNLSKKQRHILNRQDTSSTSDDITRVNVILKGDVHGSVEAILDVFDTYDCNDQCRLNVVHYGVGPITDGDIELAKAFDAIIYSFSLPLPAKRNSNVMMREFNIIYRLIEDLQNEINKRIPEIDVEEEVGRAEVLKMFEITNEKKKKVLVCGCRCISGLLKKNLRYKVLRNSEVLFDGKCEPLLRI